MNKREWAIFLVYLSMLLLIVLTGLAGCHKPIESEIGAKLTTEEAKKEVVISITEYKEKLKLARATDILRFIFILGAALSIMAWMRGASGAWESFVGSLAGLIFVHFDQTLAQVKWPYIVGMLFILIGFICFLYRDRIGKSAFTKKLNGGELTKAEQKIVDKAKKKLEKTK